MMGSMSNLAKKEQKIFTKSLQSVVSSLFRRRYLVFGLLFFITGTARAEGFREFLFHLQRAKDSRYRRILVEKLGRYHSPLVYKVLKRIVRSKKEKVRVRIMAAKILLKRKDFSALPLLRRLSRRGRRSLRWRIRRLFRRYCPRRIRRRRARRFYLDFSKVKISGAYSELAREMMFLRFREYLRRRGDVVTIWSRCRRPRSWMLRRKRLKGYYVNLNLKIWSYGGVSYSKIGMILARYPSNAIRSFLSAKANAAAPLSPRIVGMLIRALMRSHMRSLGRFLDARR